MRSALCVGTSFPHAVDGTVGHVLFVPFSTRSEGSLGDGRSLCPTSSSGRDVGDRSAPCSYPPQIFCGCRIRGKLLGIVGCYVDHARYRIFDLFFICLGTVHGSCFFRASLGLDRFVGSFLRGLLVDPSVRSLFGNPRRDLANKSSRSFGVSVRSGRRAHCPIDGRCTRTGRAFGSGGDASTNVGRAPSSPRFDSFGNDCSGSLFRNKNTRKPNLGDFRWRS